MSPILLVQLMFCPRTGLLPTACDIPPPQWMVHAAAATHVAGAPELLARTLLAGVRSRGLPAPASGNALRVGKMRAPFGVTSAPRPAADRAWLWCGTRSCRNDVRGELSSTSTLPPDRPVLSRRIAAPIGPVRPFAFPSRIVGAASASRYCRCGNGLRIGPVPSLRALLIRLLFSRPPDEIRPCARLGRFRDVLDRLSVYREWLCTLVYSALAGGTPFCVSSSPGSRMLAT